MLFISLRSATNQLICSMHAHTVIKKSIVTKVSLKVLFDHNYKTLPNLALVMILLYTKYTSYFCKHLNIKKMLNLYI